MAISHQDIRTNYQWRSSTELTEAQFSKLVTLFSQAYEEMFDESMKERQNQSLGSHVSKLSVASFLWVIQYQMRFDL